MGLCKKKEAGQGSDFFFLASGSVQFERIAGQAWQAAE